MDIRTCIITSLSAQLLYTRPLISCLGLSIVRKLAFFLQRLHVPPRSSPSAKDMADKSNKFPKTET